MTGLIVAVRARVSLPHSTACPDAWPNHDALGPALAVRSRTVLFRQGDQVQALYLIDTGLVKLMRSSSEGCELMVALRGPGWLLGSASALVARPHLVSAEAIGETTLRPLALVSFHRAATCSAAGGWLARMLAQEAHEAVVLASELGSLGLRKRLELLLARLARAGQRTSSGSLVLPPLTRAEIAAAVGASRERVSKELSCLERQQLIGRTRGRVTVPLASRLRDRPPSPDLDA